MADIEALKEQLMSMKRNGKGFLCVGTDDPKEAAQIMKIAAELSQEEEKEQYEDEEDCGGEYVYAYRGEIYDDAAVAELVAEEYEDVVCQKYGNSLRDFLRDLDTEDIDYLKDGVLERLDTLQAGQACMGIVKKTIRKRSY